MKVFLVSLLLFVAIIAEAQQLKRGHSISAVLEALNESDQQYRKQLDSLQERFAFDSKEILEQWRKINSNDSINLQIVSGILDKYGWLGPPRISEKAADAIFLAIQHSDLGHQKKYLPMLQTAVRDGAARPRHLAYLTDRILVQEGKFQLYGSQLSGPKKGELLFYPIADEKNVNVRRKSIGLSSLEEYSKGLLREQYRLPTDDPYQNKYVFLGFIMDNNNQPIANAEVVLTNGMSARSDDYGRFRMIVPRQDNNLTLSLRKKGYSPATYQLQNAGKDVLEMAYVLEKQP